MVSSSIPEHLHFRGSHLLWVPEHLTAPAPAPPHARPGGQAVSHLELHVALNASAWTPVATLLWDSSLQTAQDAMAAVCLTNHCGVIRTSPEPTPGGAGSVAAQSLAPGRPEHTDPSLPTQSCQAEARCGFLAPFSSGVPGPLSRQLALGPWGSGCAPAPLGCCWQGRPGEASRDCPRRARGRTRRAQTDRQQKAGSPTQSSLVGPENEAKRRPPHGRLLGQPRAGSWLPSSEADAAPVPAPTAGCRPGHPTAVLAQPPRRLADDETLPGWPQQRTLSFA